MALGITDYAFLGALGALAAGVAADLAGALPAAGAGVPEAVVEATCFLAEAPCFYEKGLRLAIGRT